MKSICAKAHTRSKHHHDPHKMRPLRRAARPQRAAARGGVLRSQARKSPWPCARRCAAARARPPPWWRRGAAPESTGPLPATRSRAEARFGSADDPRLARGADATPPTGASAATRATATRRASTRTGRTGTRRSARRLRRRAGLRRTTRANWHTKQPRRPSRPAPFPALVSSLRATSARQSRGSVRH